MPRQMGGAKPYSSDAWDAGRAVEEMCSRRTRRARRRVVGAMRVGWRVIVLSTIAGAAGTIKSMGDGFDDENVKGSASKPRGGGLVPGGAVVPPRMCRHERVYPRGCGATARFATRLSAWEGLSPRVRGHPAVYDGGQGDKGSIPAGAGSPHQRPACRQTQRVYPRGCGVTARGTGGGSNREGLSPRVRGHRGRSRQSRSRQRSIPAGAGSPLLQFVRTRALRARRSVYRAENAPVCRGAGRGAST